MTRRKPTPARLRVLRRLAQFAYTETMVAGDLKLRPSTVEAIVATGIKAGWFERAWDGRGVEITPLGRERLEEEEAEHRYG